MSVSIGIVHAGQRASELRAASLADLFENVSRIRGRAEHVARPLSSLLAHTDIDGRNAEGCRLHDAAAGISYQCVYMAEKAPIGDCSEVDKDMRILPRSGEGPSAFDEMVAARIG